MTPLGPLTVLGNPDNRRVGLFLAAADRLGVPPPRVVSWRDFLLGRAAPEPGAVVRIDSPGEDAEVDRLLRGAPAACEPGEIVGLADWYDGLVAALARLDPSTRPVNRPEDIAVMCDKRRCHAVLSAAGVPVPPALPPVPDYAGLRAAMRDAGWSRVFVKPAHGSSASGVIALAVNGPRISAVTSVERDGARLYNSLRVRRYETEWEVADIVDRLAPDRLHVERWLPKAGLGDRVVDVRVVVTAGKPGHAVVRASRTPLTNLHLGNARGDLAALRGAVGSEGWEAALHTCTQIARCFPGTLHVGVDLMFLAGWRGHAVAEVNAFGDLLPGVVADGVDTYGAQLRALYDGEFDRWAALCVT